MKEYKYNPEKYNKLTKEQIEMIQKDGHTFAIVGNGKIVKVTKDDLYVTKESYEKLIK